MALTPEQSKQLVDDLSTLTSLVSQQQNIQQGITAAQKQLGDMQTQIQDLKTKVETNHGQLFT